MTGGRSKTGITAAQAMLLAGRGRMRRRLKARVRALRALIDDIPTQSETARHLGLSESTVSKYERGLLPKAHRR